VTGADDGPGWPAADGIATRLHAALLPAGLPVLPQAAIAAQYLPAPADESAGGDWFDAVVLPGGVVALTTGEVPGGGLAASAAAVQLRAVLNELLTSVPDAAAVLARVDTFAARTPALIAAALAVAVLDPRSGTLRYAVCGYPAPLVVAAGESARFLDGRCGPLGTGSTPTVTTAVLERGELLVLYSDAVTARPGRTPAEALAELARVASDAAANRSLPSGPGARAASAADRVCQLTADLVTRTGQADDATVLAVQRLSRPVPALHLDLPAERASLGEVRLGFGQWLAGADPLADGQGALQLALGEIVANAIQHAYPAGTGGSVEIDAEIRADGLLECRVTDHGRWREPGHSQDRGNGLMLAAYLAGELAVSHPPQLADAATGSRGTVVTLLRRLLRPAVVGPVGGARAAAVPGPPFRAEVPAIGHVVLSGQADSSAAERLAGRLLSACRGGVLPLTVDLTGVTRLDSAAVQILFQVRDRLAAHRQDLSLVAEPGSPAGAALDLACLPYAGISE
jgi:anti-sigma regulatory factor (Ser/Thr protein kinase)/anti-anti-sigma regulatory factor